MSTHLFKRVLPSMRVKLDDKIGSNAARGLTAVLILSSVILMIIGFRIAPSYPIYTPLPGIGWVAVSIMIFAFWLSNTGQAKGVTRAWLRHPMLLGVSLWSFAHLLVNGDIASVILFASLGLWAIIEIILINRAQGAWARPQKGTIKGEIIALVANIIGIIVIIYIHIWLGHNPLLGTYP